jgi:hypothetical protein
MFALEMCLVSLVLRHVLRSRPILQNHSSQLAGSSWKGGGGQELTYSDFKVDEFLCECAHLIVEAESVFSSLGRCEDEVPLSLLLTIHHDLVSWTNNLVINIERPSCLDLCIEIF